MKEDFLHYVWKFLKIDSPYSLHTTANEPIEIISNGYHNTENSGPDFFNAQLIINSQKWAGNIEIHLKSSDWYAHNHQNDSAYENVILHVVWEHDVEVYRKNNSPIPTLTLQNITSVKTLQQYKNLINGSTNWINCSNQLEKVSAFTLNNWLERLYFERLNSKSKHIATVFNSLNSHWEATCFSIIAKYYGGNNNGMHFLNIIKSIPFSVLQKTTSIIQIEALLFGQANLLNGDLDDFYYVSLQQEYKYLKHKYKLTPLLGLELQFFRLRPTNFPTIRLAQLAQLLANHPQLFAVIKEEFNPKILNKLFKSATSIYWKTHYNFGKESKKTAKTTTDSFIDILIINAIIPLQFYYAKTNNKEVGNNLLNLISSIRSEKNSIVSRFKEEKLLLKNAMESQAAIQLKKEYCDSNLCLKCAIGFELLKGN